MDLAYDYFAEAALMDLDDLEHNTRDGVHIASLAGAWIAAVAGFGGMRDMMGVLTFKPRLPGPITLLRYRIAFRHRRLTVEVNHDEAKYTLVEGPSLEITHYGDKATIDSDSTLTLPIPPIPERERPTQPAGRAPTRRRRARQA
jgi:alpha,alpha-trehalose phosphorylase